MVKAKVREEYQSLARQELLDKAYELGVSYLENSGSCSQCVVAGVHAILDFEDLVVKLATSPTGGQALQSLGTCGVLVGGTMVLDYFFGRPVENLSDKEIIQANKDILSSANGVAMLLADRFVKEYGTFVCAQMQRQFFGRVYYFADPEDMEKFGKAGNSKKCQDVVGKAARWIMEILLEKGAIKL